jgi:hypothetical protein
MSEEVKVKRVNSYNLALRDWNAERKKQGHKWTSPKKGTKEYDEVQELKKQIESKNSKPVQEVKKVVSFNEDKVKSDPSNVKKRDSYDSVIKKLLKTNTILTERIVAEKDPKKVFELVEKLKENTEMLSKARSLKDSQ